MTGDPDNPDGYTPAEITAARIVNTVAGTARDLLTMGTAVAQAGHQLAAAHLNRLARCRAYVQHLPLDPDR